jgi:shikimate dehydrogenase
MTDKYAVIGNPIAHSKSPLIHAEFAKQTQQDISYEAILAPLDGFEAKIQELIKAGYKGVNVTVPFKFEAFHLAQELSDPARMAQAVNTLEFREDGHIFGANTDGIGLVRDISHNLNVNINNKRVLLMGAGGAAYGVGLPLCEAGAILSVANRTPKKAEDLARSLNQLNPIYKVVAKGYQKLVGEDFDIVINATSVGLTNDLPPISDNIFAENALAYDMMYSRETPFKKLAVSNVNKNVRFADGLGMLVEQAAEAFYLWRGVRPETHSVIEMIRAL